MIFHGAWTEEEMIGNFRVRAALAQEGQHVVLAPGERQAPA